MLARRRGLHEGANTHLLPPQDSEQHGFLIGTNRPTSISYWTSQRFAAADQTGPPSLCVSHLKLGEGRDPVQVWEETGMTILIRPRRVKTAEK